MENAINIFEGLRKKLKAYSYALRLISWDSSTEAPKGCFPTRSKMIGVLSEELYKIQTSNEYSECVNALYQRVDDLEPTLAHEIIEVKKDIEKAVRIPMYEFVEYQILMGSSQEIWTKAKLANDFSIFAPTLEKVVEFKHKYMKYLETDNLKGYDILLDDFEPGFSTKEYDQFFDVLKEKLVPFFKKVSKLKLDFNEDFDNLKYPKQQQIEFCDYLQDVLGFDRNRGLMKESEHPFTSGVGTTDVRWTNHYYEDDFSSSIFSAIHEIGHALYEQQINPEFDETFNSNGASMSMHESQSRMYENMIGRSRVFWETHFSKLQKLYPQQLKDVSVDDFYKLINRTQASFVRVEADELSYPIHIMLRYDIEKGLMDGTYKVADIEKVWNDLFYQYMGIKVEKPSQGVLQDVHWSAGMFGYFPTYALGSAYAAHFYKKMAEDVDIEGVIRSGSTKEINEWLKDKIHKYGSSLYPKEIIDIAIGEEFNPEHYVDYLIAKYTKLYGIK